MAERQKKETMSDVNMLKSKVVVGLLVELGAVINWNGTHTPLYVHRDPRPNQNTGEVTQGNITGNEKRTCVWLDPTLMGVPRTEKRHRLFSNNVGYPTITPPPSVNGFLSRDLWVVHVHLKWISIHSFAPAALNT